MSDPTNVPVPSRLEVRDRLLDLLSGRRTREEVADWAVVWVIQAEPDVDDQVVWDGLTALAGADLKVAPDTYLHNEADFHRWLDKVESAD